LVISDFAIAVVNRLKKTMDLPGYFSDVIDSGIHSANSRFTYCYNSQKNKYSLSPFHVDSALTYLVYLASSIYQTVEHPSCKIVADAVYYYLRSHFHIDVYPSRIIPPEILFVHPLGSILGNARFGRRLVVYQQVTVGGNPKLEYPVIGDDVVLFSKSSVLGRSVIGNNCAVGAGVILNNQIVADDTIVYLDNGCLKQKQNTHSNRERFFL
jgi:serine O-acetyltransferase